MIKKITLLVLAMVTLLSGCTEYNRNIAIYVDGDGSLTIGDVEVLAEVTKGDEQLTNTPEIKPSMSLPLK